mgnify:CR=1 FL=1
MLLRWADIERELQDKGASANEINSKRQIFNNVAFQNILLTKFGFITENTFGMDSERLSVSKTTGTLDDLGKLDSYELIDYLECNEITYKQAATILPQQMALLGEDQIDKISNSSLEVHKI